MRALILDTAEILLRRHGLEKLNVVDVARVLNMSHGNVYRHVPSKAALRAAVIHRWLGRVSQQTEAIARSDAPADLRLMQWLRELAVIKQRKVTEDAEMLAAAAKVIRDAPQVQDEHAALLTAQLAGILEAGLADGTLPGVKGPQSTATAILDATIRYHHPHMVASGGPPAAQLRGLDKVVSLIIGGLKVAAR
ncbi:TetR/AcrR family transcriptional regulator [Lichenicoccus sp.]|uniref:TetR/AcrR family transcriptional regulator n=1 Tax=Lichenicoccus sp. TaxID=2781899 RepID=UPI003D0FD798